MTAIELGKNGRSYLERHFLLGAVLVYVHLLFSLEDAGIGGLRFNQKLGKVPTLDLDFPKRKVRYQF